MTRRVYLKPVPTRRPAPKPKYSEAEIEAYLHRRVAEMGGSHRRVSWQNRKYAPDDLILIPAQNRNFFAECKAYGRAKLMYRSGHGRGQIREMRELRQSGCEVWVLDSFEMIDKVLDEYPHISPDAFLLMKDVDLGAPGAADKGDELDDDEESMA